jgi:glycosyltransferase involved in cell wall biosynthesis
MRILIATWSRRQVGGTETYLGRIVPLLADANHAVAFGYEVDEPEGRPSIPVPAGVETFQFRASALDPVRAWKPDVIYAHGLLDQDVEEELLGIAPGVFFGHSYYGMCISGDKTHKLPMIQPCGRKFGPPCLALYFPRRCGGLSPLTMIDDYARQRRRLSLLRRYGAAVTHSEHMRRELARHGAAGGRVFKVGFAGGVRVPEGQGATGQSANVQSVERQSADDPSANSTARLVFAGRMDRLKGGDYLLRSLPPLRGRVKRRLHVTMAGDGPERQRWERLADDVMKKTTDVAIEFPGWLGRDRLVALLDESDALVMPSLWPEPYGLAGIEANQRGVPVVAFANGAIPEWLTEGVNGCLAPADPPTVSGLADALLRCLTPAESDPSLRDGARRRGHATPDAVHVTALVDVLTRVVEDAKQRRDLASPRPPEPASRRTPELPNPTRPRGR